ncbi:24567_t:CDS:2, partial [Racocetra persica]
IEWINELWEEIDSYWSKIDENKEFDLVEWMHRITNEIMFKTTTGVKNNAVAAYYYTIFAPENIKSLDENEQEKLKDSEDSVQSVHTYMDVKNLLKNKEILFDKVGKIVKERRIEIENTPLDQPLRHDFLTSHITTNTPRDINIINHSEAVDIVRPMNDKEIVDNIFEAITAGDFYE